MRRRCAAPAWLAAALLSCSVGSAEAAQLLLDQGRRHAGLWLFPVLDDPNAYYYIPGEARLATRPDGRPEFSFLFYSLASPTEPAPADAADPLATLGGSAGGALVTFLVEYQTPPAQLEAAQAELVQWLRERNRPHAEAQIAGPVIFDDGQYVVVSSLPPDAGAAGTHVLSARSAPVIEGGRVAVSLSLPRVPASILLESLQTATPDLSLAFDLTFTGLTDSYDATLDVDWRKVKSSIGGGGGINLYYVALQAEVAVERLFQDGSVNLNVSGEHPQLEAITEKAHAKILELMFAPIEIDRVPERERGGLLEALGGMLGAAGSSGGGTSAFGLSAAFRLKDLASEGSVRISLDGRSRVTRRATLVATLGDLYQRYGSDARYFRIKDMGDGPLANRRIDVIVDGELRPEFGSFVNNAVVTLRKVYADASKREQQLVVTRARAAAEDGVAGSLSYTSGGEADRDTWLQYEYRTRWSFNGGGQFESDWVQNDVPAIVLTTPFRRQLVHLDADLPALRAQGVRAVDIKLSYPFFGQMKTTRRNAVLGAQSSSLEPIELVMPRDAAAYDFEITWLMSDDTRRTRRGSGEAPVLLLDNLPNP